MRLRRPNGSYARGSIVSQSFIDGMKVRHQWEQVNGRWYAFDEQGYLKTDSSMTQVMTAGFMWTKMPECTLAGSR